MTHRHMQMSQIGLGEEVDVVREVDVPQLSIQRNHRLKCWPHWFDEIACGRKRFDVRFCGDRIYQAGDTLELFRWDPHSKAVQTNPEHETPGSGFFVTVVAAYHNLPGVNSNYCVLSIALIDTPE